MPLVDIVIPTYNNLEELKLCLHSFQSQSVSDFRILVCVDGSSDGTCEYLEDHERFNYQFCVLDHAGKVNKGRSATRNLALPHLAAKYVVFLDSDFTVHADFIESHLELLNIDEVVSVGDIFYKKGNIWRDYALSRGKHKFEKNFSEIPFKYLETGNVMMPTPVFWQLEGFDEAFSTYGGEDTELACRIRKRFNLKTVFNRKAVAYGMMEKPLAAALAQREEFARTGLRYIRKKHPDMPDVFNVKFLESPIASFLYMLLPDKILFGLAENSLLPKYLRLKLVHLLVFCNMYRGYHARG